MRGSESCGPSSILGTPTIDRDLPVGGQEFRVQLLGPRHIYLWQINTNTVGHMRIVAVHLYDVLG